MHKHLSIIALLSVMLFIILVMSGRNTLPKTLTCEDMQRDTSLIGSLQNKDDLVAHIENYYLLDEGQVTGSSINRFDWDIDDRRYSLYLQETDDYILHIEWLEEWRIQENSYRITKINFDSILNCFGPPEYYIAEVLQGTEADRLKFSIFYPELHTIATDNEYGMKDPNVTYDTPIESITILSARNFEERVQEEQTISTLQRWPGEISALIITDKRDNN